MKSWFVTGSKGFESLELKEVPIPELGDTDVLVRFHGSSLNYRDLIIPKGQYPFGFRENVVPASDGAGTVAAVGSRVTRFQNGDRVMVLFNQGHQAGVPTPTIVGTTGVGGTVDGCLREYGAFSENGLVSVPEHLNFREAATLGCAGLTAWNALYGLTRLTPGQTVLTQGTGGVSLFAIQFAKAAGATVISTTSSAKKAELLKKLGADHVLNYKEDANWGETAKKLTSGGLGVQHVIEVGGPNTMAQSLKAVAMEGVITIIGFLGGQKGEKQPGFLECLTTHCVVRGILVGSRLQLEEMSRAIEANKIRPVVDEKVFKLEQAKEAYQYMWDQKHFGKVTIEIEE